MYGSGDKRTISKTMQNSNLLEYLRPIFGAFPLTAIKKATPLNLNQYI
jgi:hypothetical protein